MLEFIQENWVGLAVFLLFVFASLISISYFFDKKEAKYAQYCLLERIKKQDKDLAAYKKLCESFSADLMRERDKVKNLKAELLVKNEIIQDFPARDSKTGRFTKRTK